MIYFKILKKYIYRYIGSVESVSQKNEVIGERPFSLILIMIENDMYLKNKS